MTTASDSDFHTIFRFVVDVSNLASNAVESSEVGLSNVNWKVKLQKVSIEENNKNILGVHLVSGFGDKTVDWSCEAQATFKLLRNDGKLDQSIVKYLPKQKFCNDERSHGFDEFVDWNEFLEHFASKNKAIFMVEISTEPSIQTNRPSQFVDRVQFVEREFARFRVTFEHVDKLTSAGSFSSQYIVRGINWKIKVEKVADKLGLFLYGAEKDMDMNWLYEAEATFRLIPFDEDAKPLERSIAQKFHCGLSNWGFSGFLSWTDFMDEKKKYVEDNRAIVVVELKVNEPEPRWKIADFKLSKENSLLLCIICLECFSSGNIFSTKCGHLFCKPCFDKTIEKRKTCPNCNAPTDANELHPIFFA